VKVRAFLADSVQSADGKLYALGAGWNRLTAGGFPARHDRVGIGILVTVEAGDEGEHNLELMLLDQNGLPITLFVDAAGTQQFALNATFETQTSPDGFADVVVPLALNINGLAFPAAGTYAFSIRIGGDEREHLPFRVDLASGNQTPGSTSIGADGPDAGYL
jgi:hypothetical protein